MKPVSRQMWRRVCPRPAAEPGGRTGRDSRPPWLSRLLAGLLAAACEAGPQGTTEAAVTVTLDFMPRADTLLVSEDLSISVRVDAAAQSLKTLQVAFAYDPAVLEVREVLQGDLFASSGQPTFFQVLDTRDSVRVAESVLGPYVSVDGPGEIFRVRVRARSPGLSLLRYQGAVLIDVNGAQFDILRNTGSVLVRTTVDVGDERPALWLRGRASPMVGQAVLDYGAPPGGPLRLVWFDVQGRASGRQLLAPGRGEIRLRLPAAGVYFAELRLGDAVRRSRIVWIP